jgi:ADP-L-glycero-D-manno-heptose 6-epimerase
MIIITGGAGFVGSNLVAYLNKKGRKDIIIIDEFSQKNKYNNIADIEFIDVLNFQKGFDYLKNVLKNYDIEVVFHIGANADVLINDCNIMLDDNFEHSKFWFYFSKENNIPFIYASSSAVYGNSQCFKVKKECEKPHNEYAFSKWLFDKFVLNNLNIGNKVIGFRFFNIFGMREFHKGKNASLPYRFFEFIREKGYIDLFDAEIKRDYVYVDDVCEVLYYAWNNEIDNGIYNLGSGNPISHEKLANFVVETLIERKIIEKGNSYIKKIPMPENLKTKFQFYTIAEELPNWVRYFTINNEIKIKSYINKLIERFYNVNSL